MTTTQDPNAQLFAGVDWSQYMNWEKKVAPNGATYYKVPGTGFLLDPFLSSKNHKPFLWVDPSAEIEKRDKAEKAAKDAASPLNQTIGPAGLLGGALIGKYAYDKVAGPTASGIVPKDQGGGVYMSDGTIKGGAGQVQTPAAPPTPANPAAVQTQTPDAQAPAVSGIYGVRENADGSVVMSDGSVVAPDGAVTSPAGKDLGNQQSGYGTAMNYAQVVLGAYNAYKDWKAGNKASAAGDVAQAGVGVANIAGYDTGNAGGYIGAGKDALDLIDRWKDIKPEDRASRIEQQAGLGVADYFTFGLAGMAANALKSTPFGAKIDEKITNLQNKASKYGLDPAGFVLNSLFGHKSTKDYQNDTWGDAVKQGLVSEDVAKNWLSSDGSKETRTSDQILEQAKQDGKQLWGTIGMYQTFGPDWDKYTPDQREQISRGIAQAGIIHSEHGDWFVDNPDQAKQIRDNVLGGKGPGTMAPQPPAPQGQQLPQQPINVNPNNITPVPRTDIGKELARRMDQRYAS